MRLAITDGTDLAIDEAGRWYVSWSNGTAYLDEPKDSFRVWFLLERPLPEVRPLLNELAKSAGSIDRFPAWKVVAAAFESGSRPWTDLAVTWLPFLDDAELGMLKSSLATIRDSKWASQKSRQMARKFAR
ncbi:hypothetical protein [Mesorhizobium sp. LjNodule214]|uniref:hypothetical protein n=1 Tax=Mesorhizobium sp. LjNodule214 TaxID=3342252 RepID=UPI003ECEC110